MGAVAGLSVLCVLQASEAALGLQQDLQLLLQKLLHVKVFGAQLMLAQLNRLAC
jgi:hypothetical protein